MDTDIEVQFVQPFDDEIASGPFVIGQSNPRLIALAGIGAYDRRARAFARLEAHHQLAVVGIARQWYSSLSP
jgi:hypothetical protein